MIWNRYENYSITLLKGLYLLGELVFIMRSYICIWSSAVQKRLARCACMCGHIDQAAEVKKKKKNVSQFISFHLYTHTVYQQHHAYSVKKNWHTKCKKRLKFLSEQVDLRLIYNYCRLFNWLIAVIIINNRSEPHLTSNYRTTSKSLSGVVACHSYYPKIFS